LTSYLVDCFKVGLFGQPEVEDRFVTRPVYEDIVTNDVKVADRIRRAVCHEWPCTEIGWT
jgi:hypothetical protein